VIEFAIVINKLILLWHLYCICLWNHRLSLVQWLCGIWLLLRGLQENLVHS